MIKGLRYPPFAVLGEVACTPEDARTFHPKRYGDDNFSVVRAKRICRHCPVKDECLAWALSHNEDVGIWGGLTPNERTYLLRKKLTPPK